VIVIFILLRLNRVITYSFLFIIVNNSLYLQPLYQVIPFKY